MYTRNDNATNTKMSQWFPAYNVQIKVRRTYGWLCPYKDYLSNRRFNAQRHTDKIHGGGEPVDSRTGETLAQKKAAALHALKYSNMQSGYMMPDTNLIAPFQLKEPSEAKAIDTQAYAPLTGSEDTSRAQNVPKPTIKEDSYSTPFLDAQLRRVKELGYGPTPPQSFGNINSKFRGPNRHLNNIPAAQRTQNYQNNSNIDYVDQLAHYDPAMALWKEGRSIANLFKNK
jgi:hypothetical protein